VLCYVNLPQRNTPETGLGVLLFSALGGQPMTQFAAVVERDADTGLYVGYVPGLPGAHTQAASLDELNVNRREVVAMLLEDGAQCPACP
jgi:predicted RNase H-like HicB family nuclease